MAEQTKVQNAEEIVKEKANVDETISGNVETVGFNSDGVKEIINKMVKNGAKHFKGVTVKSVTATRMDNYTMVGITLNSNVIGINQTKDGGYKIGPRPLVFMTSYGIAGALKNDADLAFLGNKVVEDDDLLELILTGSTIDILQRVVEEGTPATNPFSSKDEGAVYDHDIVTSYITNIKLGKVAERVANGYIDGVISKIVKNANV